MEVKSKRVCGEEPDEPSVAEDELSANVDGFEEADSTEVNGVEVSSLAHLLGLYCREGSIAINCTGVGRLLGEGQSGNPDPGGSCKSHEDGTHEVRIVVSEAGDGGRRCESSCGTGNLVEDVDGSVHATKAVDISTDNISGAAKERVGKSGTQECIPNREFD